jgi:thymidylate kinase
MENESFSEVHNEAMKSIVIEGGDQVGKGDTVKELVKEFQAEKISVCTFSFPQYATPLGFAVRRFLSEGVKELDGIEGSRRELEVRMMMYALDRLQALESILRVPEEKRGVLLFDRGPFSNALTIAYGSTKLENFSKQDMQELAELGYTMENYLINRLNLDNCVIQLIEEKDEINGNGIWRPSRVEGEDQYETEAVQRKAEITYREFKKIVNEGWKEIVSKDRNGKWIPREERNKAVREFMNTRVNISGLSNPMKVTVETFNVYDIAKSIYGVDISSWQETDPFYYALIDNDKRNMYELGGVIANRIVSQCEEITIKDEGVKRAMYNILEEYPECLTLLDQYYGVEFVEKLRKAVYE